MVVSASVTSPDLADLVLAIKYEQNGAVLRRDLLRNLRAAVRPAAEEAKASIRSMPSSGERRGRASLRASIARQVTTQVSLTSRSAKVKVRVRKRGFPRGFSNAPKAVGLPQGWRHPVFPHRGGQVRWVPQVGKPGWFDEPLKSHRAQYRAAVEAAMQECANRIARKV